MIKFNIYEKSALKEILTMLKFFIIEVSPILLICYILYTEIFHLNIDQQ